MKVTHLTLMILEINAIIDSGKHDNITIQEMENHISTGDVIAFLKTRCVGSCDLSWVPSASEFETDYILRLQDILGAYAGSERRKWGVENKGLCLLLAWTNEIIQQGDNLHW